MTSTLAPYHVPHAVAFASGMDLGLTAAACVAAAGCVIALIALPSRANGASRDGR